MPYSHSILQNATEWIQKKGFILGDIHCVCTSRNYSIVIQNENTTAQLLLLGYSVGGE